MFESPASSNVSSQQLQQASQTQLRPPAGLVVTAPHKRATGMPRQRRLRLEVKPTLSQRQRGLRPVALA